MNALVLATTLSTFLLSNISGAATDDDLTHLLFQPSPPCVAVSSRLDDELSKVHLAHTAKRLNISRQYHAALLEMHISAKKVLADILTAFSQTNGIVYPLTRDTMEPQKTFLKQLIFSTGTLMGTYAEAIKTKNQASDQPNYSGQKTQQSLETPYSNRGTTTSSVQLDIETKALAIYFESTKKTHIARMVSCLDEYIKQLAHITISYKDQNDLNQRDKITRIERDIAQADCEKKEFAALAALIDPSN